MAYSWSEDYIYSIEQIHIKQLNPQILQVKPRIEYIDLQITSSNTSKNVKWSTDPLDPPTSSEEDATEEERFSPFT